MLYGPRCVVRFVRCARAMRILFMYHTTNLACVRDLKKKHISNLVPAVLAPPTIEFQRKRARARSPSLTNAGGPVSTRVPHN